MASSRRIEVDKGAVLIVPEGDARGIDIKAGAIVVIYTAALSPQDVAALVTAAKDAAKGVG